MKTGKIFFLVVVLSLFFLNKSYSQSADVNIGTESANFEYTDVRYNTESNFYEVTITRPMRLSINATIISDVFNGAYLDFYDGYSAEYIPGANSNEFNAIIETDLLPAGTYTIASNQNGCGISFQITINGSIRDVFRDSTPIGNFDNDFTYTDTQNTDNYGDDYGVTGNDVFYQFTLNH